MSLSELTFLIFEIVVTLMWIKVVADSDSHEGDDSEKEKEK